MFSPPSKIFRSKRDPDSATFLYQDRTISWREFCNATGNLAQKLKQADQQRWVIYCDNAFSFAIGFFALLLAKKTIILPHNIQSKTVANFPDIADAILINTQLHNSPLPIFQINEQSNAPDIKLTEEISLDSPIIFFTSGSTKDPTAIYKTLRQLESEVTDLEKMWPSSQSVVVDTVSHQHLYGFLFRFLWPLCGGNLINSLMTFALDEIASMAKLYPKMILVSSPAFIKRLPSNSGLSLKNFSYVFSSGGPLKEEDVSKCAEIFNTPPIEILGSTETGGIGWRIQSETWRIFPSVKIKTDNADRLLVKSAYIFEKDYLTTSDTIELLNNNTFKLKERSDRIVKIEEKKVSLVAMENRLMEHQIVKHCHIIKLIDSRQTLGAIIELTESGQDYLDKNGKLKLDLLLRTHLAQYFEITPQKWRYVKEFPFNSQGKLILDEMRKLFIK